MSQVKETYFSEHYVEGKPQQRIYTEIKTDIDPVIVDKGQEGGNGNCDDCRVRRPGRFLSGRGPALVLAAGVT